MPATYYPEGNTAQPDDDELRSMNKLAWQLYDSLGAKPLAAFPEGTLPQPDDNEERLMQKINALLA